MCERYLPSVCVFHVCLACYVWSMHLHVARQTDVSHSDLRHSTAKCFGLIKWSDTLIGCERKRKMPNYMVWFSAECVFSKNKIHFEVASREHIHISLDCNSMCFCKYLVTFFLLKRKIITQKLLLPVFQSLMRHVRVFRGPRAMMLVPQPFATCIINSLGWRVCAII